MHWNWTGSPLKSKYKAMLNKKVVLEAETLVNSNQSSRSSTLQFKHQEARLLLYSSRPKSPRCSPPQEVSTSTKPTVSRPSKRLSNQMVFITPFNGHPVCCHSLIIILNQLRRGARDVKYDQSMGQCGLVYYLLQCSSPPQTSSPTIPTDQPQKIPTKNCGDQI
eukprot:scaffold15460_cov39-Cyclotella_meneghiniana.AAC.5